MKHFTWTPSDLTKLRKLSKTHSRQEAAKIIGCTYSALIGKCKRDGISFRKHGENHPTAKRSNDDVRLIRLLLDEKMPVKEIAEKFEVTPTTVYNLKYHNFRNQDHMCC